jgi:hypothetical protein
MNNIDQFSDNELAAVSGGMMMFDPKESGSIGAWAVGGPAGFLVFQGGLAIGEAINGIRNGHKNK